MGIIIGCVCALCARVCVCVRVCVRVCVLFQFYTAMSRTSLEGMQSLCRRMLRITERTPVQRVGQRLGRLRHVGLSPLHAAVRAQRPDIVAWLLDLCVRSGRCCLV